MKKEKNKKEDKLEMEKLNVKVPGTLKQFFQDEAAKDKINFSEYIRNRLLELKKKIEKANK